MVLCTSKLEACIESFLEEAEEDMELDDLPPLENVTLIWVPVPNPVIPSFIPFAVSIGQHCIPPKSLLRKVSHPYQDPVGWCHCEPGGWCSELPCSSWKRLILWKVQGCGSTNGSLRLGRSCCNTSDKPCDQSGFLYGQRTPTCTLCSGSPELWLVGSREGRRRGSSTGLGGWIRDGLFWGLCSQVFMWWSNSQCWE